MRAPVCLYRPRRLEMCPFLLLLSIDTARTAFYIENGPRWGRTEDIVKDGSMAIDLDEAKVNRSEFTLWLGWTLATAAGMILGFVPFAFLAPGVNVLVIRLLLPLVAGVLVGLFQWLVL